MSDKVHIKINHQERGAHKDINANAHKENKNVPSDRKNNKSDLEIPSK